MAKIKDGSQFLDGTIIPKTINGNEADEAGAVIIPIVEPFYVPADVIYLSQDSTKQDILDAFGSLEQYLATVAAIEAGKQIIFVDLDDDYAIARFQNSYSTSSWKDMWITVELYGFHYELYIEYDVSNEEFIVSVYTLYLLSATGSEINTGTNNLTVVTPKAIADSDIAFTSDVDTALGGKQDTLVSGTNIKTINDTSLLGSGNIVIEGGGSGITEGDVTSLIQAAILADNQAKYYVGKIIIDVANVNPATYLGFGTWVAWGSGRVPVGVNTGDGVLNTADKTGGSTNPLTSHTHSQNSHHHVVTSRMNPTNGSNLGSEFQINRGDLASDGTYYNMRVNGTTNDSYMPNKVGALPVTATNNNTGNNTNHSNWQPFITCYMWKRTA